MSEKQQKAIQMNMRVIADVENSQFTWELWSRGMKLTTMHKYKLVEQTIVAAKRIAGQLNMEISKCEYYEPQTEYRQLMKI